MICQANKRLSGTLNAYYYMKENNFRSLHTTRLYGKGKTLQTRKDQ